MQFERLPNQEVTERTSSLPQRRRSRKTAILFVVSALVAATLSGVAAAIEPASLAAAIPPSISQSAGARTSPTLTESNSAVPPASSQPSSASPSSSTAPLTTPQPFNTTPQVSNGSVGQSFGSGAKARPAVVGGCVCASVVVQLRSTTVIADNLSQYPNSRITVLVQLADRGLVTQDPVNNNVAGLMHNSDRVIVTQYGMYWIDVANRSGMLGGMWGLKVDGSGNANFSYIVGSHNWGPNQLLPGSNGTANPNNSVAGLGVRVLAVGGHDGTSDPGHGTFQIQGANDQASFTSLVQGYDHLYQFSGVLTQENANGYTTMIDSDGNRTQMRFVLTYRFRDANDPNTSYTSNGSPLSDQYVNRVEVSLTPSNTTGSCSTFFVHCIQLNVFDVGDDLQFTNTPQAQALYSKSNQHGISRFSTDVPVCANASYAAGTYGVLCNNIPSGQLNFIEEPPGSPPKLSANDSSDFCSFFCGRAMGYIHPAGFTIEPARDTSVYNPALQAIAVESQFFNGDGTQPWYDGGTTGIGLDQTLIPY